MLRNTTMAAMLLALGSCFIAVQASEERPDNQPQDHQTRLESHDRVDRNDRENIHRDRVENRDRVDRDRVEERGRFDRDHDRVEVDGRFEHRQDYDRGYYGDRRWERTEYDEDGRQVFVNYDNDYVPAGYTTYDDGLAIATDDVGKPTKPAVAYRLKRESGRF